MQLQKINAFTVEVYPFILSENSLFLGLFSSSEFEMNIESTYTAWKHQQYLIIIHETAYEYHTVAVSCKALSHNYSWHHVTFSYDRYFKH